MTATLPMSTPMGAPAEVTMTAGAEPTQYKPTPAKISVLCLNRFARLLAPNAPAINAAALRLDSLADIAAGELVNLLPPAPPGRSPAFRGASD